MIYINLYNLHFYLLIYINFSIFLVQRIDPTCGNQRYIKNCIIIIIIQIRSPTEHAILEVIDRTIAALDSNEAPINIFLDLSKAFVTLDHSILLSKLQLYGTDADALKLMESYLRKKNILIYNDSNSESLPIITDVPQGSILGPLLFLIYIYIYK